MSSKRSILVLPGGAYHRHAPHEAEPVAEWLESLGWSARVVRYPVLTPHPGPLDAVRREVAAERASGAELVGVLGFSAGGHLAGHAALAAEPGPGERPDFAVLAYPVVSMLRVPHTGSRDVLVGDGDGERLDEELSLEQLVRADSPPMFLWHTAGDDVVRVQHTYLLGSALAEAGVEHEVHTFPGDVHGIGLAAESDAAEWTSLAADWLRRR